MVVETSPAAELFLIGRVLLGGVLAYLGVSNMLDAENKIEYARSTGIPFAGLAVPVSFVLLILGGLGILLGVYPMIASVGVIAFFAGVTPAMHAFWRIDDPDERSQEKTQFLVNFALLGSALIVLVIGSATWPYAP
ncbi:doxx protein [Halogeometricum borinquense DSM 11551]|uniref:DoxX protein n=1 Tax=Halogeometricum borinquense (strain ATCC 700274 / DSM 11551 / JCM 10706 / KCTC 4070 / PR3) TaxID=469382 RepID=E4NN55_HALBP|nr:DoxX family membrane protein [Halogeometricum borinquense]ADQ66285.1 DoxX protein [Halogeometricum borinquense DSM 11551]ELY27725.1 doxx protein [Halogeometricum borinquense DSM 11551]